MPIGQRFTAREVEGCVTCGTLIFPAEVSVNGYKFADLLPELSRLDAIERHKSLMAGQQPYLTHSAAANDRDQVFDSQAKLFAVADQSAPLLIVQRDPIG